ncbi:ribosome recycling factor [Modestobacter sp. I12A-02628]|uniref:Ribosome-recycling factor n=1 Tax=Goekera deserti TaxID=2497753 RepID=A0A7K3WH48_9ACTN|nr:ribosome recycling factor [Goekera deserti]MPQ97250.1 ribosome recycling factor [Goekera deserti]NDI50240.1 ribosome recycling factor [Goekera deserti]NEL55808.1 ribosome recycling factor [Goekera deserti]
MIDDTLLDAEERMDKALSVAREDLGSVRTGRAAPSMFNKILVDYYGALTPVPQMASISIPEARMAVIKPYDMTQLQAIERAIRDSDLGVNPGNDGQIIRVTFPQLTQDRRRDLAKVARGKGEDAKVAIRNVRRRAKEELDRINKEGEAGEDEVRRAEKDLDDLTATHTAAIDEAVKNKEAELLEV